MTGVNLRFSSRHTDNILKLSLLPYFIWRNEEYKIDQPLHLRNQAVSLLSSLLIFHVPWITDKIKTALNLRSSQIL